MRPCASLAPSCPKSAPAFNQKLKQKTAALPHRKTAGVWTRPALRRAGLFALRRLTAAHPAFAGLKALQSLALEFADGADIVLITLIII